MWGLELTAREMEEAADVAKTLHDRLRKQGVPNGHGLRDDDATEQMEAGGSAAELAASIMLNVTWTAKTSQNKFGPDVGKRTQVRSSNKQRSSHSLIVRQRDLDKYGNVPFLLIIQTGSYFEIKGWMMAADAVKIGKLWDGGDPERPPAWFVHESKLRSIEELKDI